MNTAATAGVGANGQLNPNPAAGYALIQLANNYNRYAGGFSGFVSPLSGSNVAINSTALTVGQPYVVVSPGHGALGAATIAPVADVSGSLASTWFSLYDNYGNTFIIWFYVTGVGGAAPVGVSGTLIQQTIAENASASTIGTALVSTISLIPAAQIGNLTAPAGVYSFTASGTTTVTVVSTQTNPYSPLPGAPADGTIPTGFTFVKTITKTNGDDWRGVGLPVGIEPTVGAAFVATSTGVCTGGVSTGFVEVPSVSGISSLEVVGDPNQSISPIPYKFSPNIGGWILVQFLAPTSSSVTTFIPTAPAAGSVVGMSFYMEAGSTTIAGE